MGKKRTRSKQVSKGITHQNPKRLGNKISKQIKKEYRQSDMRVHNQLLAHMKGKNVILTIENPDKNNTKERFIKVKAKDIWK